MYSSVEGGELLCCPAIMGASGNFRYEVAKGFVALDFLDYGEKFMVDRFDLCRCKVLFVSFARIQKIKPNSVVCLAGKSAAH